MVDKKNKKGNFYREGLYLRAPWVIILDAMLTVSPNTQYLNITVPMIPADTGPVDRIQLV